MISECHDQFFSNWSPLTLNLTPFEILTLIRSTQNIFEAKISWKIQQYPNPSATVPRGCPFSLLKVIDVFFTIFALKTITLFPPLHCITCRPPVTLSDCSLAHVFQSLWSSRQSPSPTRAYLIDNSQQVKTVACVMCTKHDVYFLVEPIYIFSILL